MSRKLFVYILAIVSFAAMAVVSMPGLQDPAYAGILLRSSRVRSRVNTRAPRVRLGRATSSTRIARRLNPIGRRSARRSGFNGVSSVLRFRQRQADHQAKLYQFQLKQAKREIKQRRKLERKREAKLRKERRALERKLRKMQSQQRAQVASATEAPMKGDKQTPQVDRRSGVEGKAESAAARKVTKVEGSVPAKPKKKRSFWSRLWMSLVGGAKN